MSLAAIVIAAAPPPPGFDAPLALLPFGDDETLVEYHVRQIIEAGVRDIEVVLGDDAARVISVVAGDNVEPVPSSTAAGPAAWLRAGAGATLRGTDTALVIEIAAPRTAAFLRTLLDAHAASGAAVTRPSYDRTPGEPWVVGEPALATLRNARGEAPTLAAAIERCTGPVHAIKLRDAQALVRIDSMESYVAARATLGG